MAELQGTLNPFSAWYVDPFSGKLIFGRKKKKFFRKFYSYFSFYATEKNFK